MLLKIKNFIKSNLSKYIIANFMNVIVGFLISSYILVKLGLKDLGIYTFFMLLLGLFSSISQGAANSYLMKNFFLQNKNQTISSVNITMLFFSIIAFSFYYILSIIGYSSYFVVNYFIIFAILKALNSTAFVVMRLYEDANSFLIYSIANKSLYSFVILFFIYENIFNIKILIQTIFVNEAIFFILLYSLLVFKYNYKFNINISYVKNNIILSLKLFPHKIFKTIYENIDKYSIQFFLGSEALGIYSMIIRLVSPIIIYIKAVNNEFSVIMSKVYSKKINLNVLISTERNILVLLVLINIVVVILALLYNNFIYNLGENFNSLLALSLIYNNNLYFYYVFYNMLFFSGKKIIYYIMGFNLMLFGTFVFFINKNILEILILFLNVNILSNIILYNLSKKNLLQLSSKIFILFVSLAISLEGILIWLIF